MNNRKRPQVWLLAVCLVAAQLLPAAGGLVGAADDWADDGRLTVLLMGSDSAFDRYGLRTDTMIVVTVEQKTGRAAIFGVPRNLINVPLPEPYASRFACGCWESILNELFQYAEVNPGLFPEENPGGEVMKAAIGHLLGLEIDYYALVNLTGFVEVIDALGGVTVYVPAAMEIYISPPYEGEDWVQYNIPGGVQHLDGKTALAWVRSREGESDYERMARQRCLLGAIGQETDLTKLMLHYPAMVDTLISRIETDIPLEVAPDLVDLAAKVDFDSVITVGITAPDYMIEYIEGYPAPDPRVIRQVVQDVLKLPLAETGAIYGTVPVICGTAAG